MSRQTFPQWQISNLLFHSKDFYFHFPLIPQHEHYTDFLHLHLPNYCPINSHQWPPSLNPMDFLVHTVQYLKDLALFFSSISLFFFQHILLTSGRQLSWSCPALRLIPCLLAPNPVPPDWAGYSSSDLYPHHSSAATFSTLYYQTK